MIDDREGVTNAEIPVVDTQEEQQPLSLRDTIKSAFEEAEGDERGEGEESPREAKPPKEVNDEVAQRLAKARQAKRDKAAAERLSDPATAKARETSQKPKADDKPTDPVNQQLPKEGKPDDNKGVEPPPFWKSKGKQVWDGLPVAAQTAIAQREKEVSDGFAYYGPRAKAFEELAKVIEPHMPAIQRFGVTVPQTIERLFGWMQAIANPDLRARGEAFKALARNFQVDLAQLADIQQQGQIPQEQSNQPPEWFSQYHAAVNTETNQLKQAVQGLYQQQQTQVAEAASSYLGSWAKDKPYYEAVKPQMKYLIDTGQVGLNAQGILDLDTAYEYAVANNAQIQTQMRAEAEAQAKAQADADAQKKAKETAARLSRARNAGSSLRPSPPLAVTQPMARRPNGAAGAARPSVRDSLLQSMREMSTE